MSDALLERIRSVPRYVTCGRVKRVVGLVIEATGVDAATGRPVAVILVADDNGMIHGAWSQNNRVFGARTAVVDPAVETPCAEGPPPPAACG